MTEFLVMADITAPETRRDLMQDALMTLAEATRAEPGCVHYQLCRDVEASDPRWLIYEIWASEQDWRLHLETVHFRHFKETVLKPDDRLSARKFHVRDV